VPILFSRIANNFSSHKDVSIIDYADGALTKLTSKFNIERIVFEDGVKINIPSGILIIQAYSPEYIRPELTISSNVKILFWILHSNNLRLNLSQNLKFFRFPEFNKLKSFVEIIDLKGGLISMDESTKLNTQKYLNVHLKSEIVPILAEKNIFEPNKAINDRNTWAYLGRIESFKTNTLIKLLESLDVLYKKGVLDKNFVFHVIGYGEDLETVKLFSKKINFRINFLGFIENKNLYNIITRLKISCIAAMGTSILDAMSFGCTVIKLNFFESQFQNYPKYYFKANENTYCLGEELSVQDFSNTFPLDLSEIYCNYQNDFDHTIKKQQSYLMTFYDDAKSLKKLDTAIDNCDLRYLEIRDYFKRSILRKIYHKYRYNLFA
tara:strand:+ start:175 stop:1311 length:1137 start_codon:yes stop_codon:yes gene_type:complete